MHECPPIPSSLRILVREYITFDDEFAVKIHDFFLTCDCPLTPPTLHTVEPLIVGSILDAFSAGPGDRICKRVGSLQQAREL